MSAVARPEKIHRKPEQYHPKSDRRCRRARPRSASTTMTADDRDEDDRHDRVAPDAVARAGSPARRRRSIKPGRHRREEDPLGVDHAREERAVGVGRRQHRRPDRLDDDRAVRRAERRMHRAQPAEERAVLRHLVVHARADQDDAVDGAERRDHDERGHQRRAAAAEQHVRGVGRDARRTRGRHRAAAPAGRSRSGPRSRR